MTEDVIYTMTSQQYVAQIKAAEQRGAVKVLQQLKREEPNFSPEIDSLIARVESGEVTL